MWQRHNIATAGWKRDFTTPGKSSSLTSATRRIALAAHDHKKQDLRE
jgi:hypothetical protein